jgi:hypothetical protein
MAASFARRVEEMKEVEGKAVVKEMETGMGTTRVAEAPVHQAITWHFV